MEIESQGATGYPGSQLATKVHNWRPRFTTGDPGSQLATKVHNWLPRFTSQLATKVHNWLPRFTWNDDTNAVIPRFIV